MLQRLDKNINKKQNKTKKNKEKTKISGANRLKSSAMCARKIILPLALFLSKSVKLMKRGDRSLHPYRSSIIQVSIL